MEINCYINDKECIAVRPTHGYMCVVLVNTWPHIKSFGQCERGNQEPVSIMSCCHVMSMGKLSQVPIWVWG